MSELFSAMNKNTTRTDNGMRTNQTSENPVVDLFYKWGASRNNFGNLKQTLAQALATDPEKTLRLILWGRDVRGGAGERQLFRHAITFCAEQNLITDKQALSVMKKIPELGRWDDIFVFVGTSLENQAFEFLGNEILGGTNGLAAKWTPRKGPVAAKFRKFLGLSPKAYRKLLVNTTNVVETQMCAKDWDNIDFSTVPSLAAARYQNAFSTNAPVKYNEYKNALIAGDSSVKINAGAVYPYDVVKSLKHGDVDIASKQWEALPNYMEGAENKRIMPLIDVSGSMKQSAGKSSSVSCMDVAISLGLYISERNKGIYENEFITFSATPKLVKTVGNLQSRYNQMVRSDWGYNTDLIKVFELILKSGLEQSVPEDQMPNTVLIISDMQFDICARFDDSAMDSIKRQYIESGYDVPNIVFWNVNSKSGAPATYNQSGVALVSGFSPSIMKSVISSNIVSPEKMMNEAIMNPRYDLN